MTTILVTFGRDPTADYPLAVTVNGKEVSQVRCVRDGRIFANGIQQGILTASNGMDWASVGVDERLEG